MPLFLKPLICGDVPAKSTVSLSPAMVIVARVSTSTLVKQSVSLTSLPVQVPSGIAAIAWRMLRSP